MSKPQYNRNIHIRVTEETRDLVNRIAKFSGKRPTDIAREALEKGLKG